ncbi:NAD(P)H dehydrogenase (quinone) [Spinactinospora alkalitolerans]|uniref:NAD(P)H dehydrogenase (Quinone) n=1 Tax=Spinactinospora alkalitolerans TaxID=687207 RepID=A0A852TUK3_9ACTN|nr:NAD(P)H-dependent oxidoreductase [Spinactinospora alkalitolerans]NYE47618.1 NAD(P)H dehydrogenase (quinone) [Spinactinospora alkalitolerans]
MKVLWIYAHPEQRSLNAALRDEGMRALAEHGHEVRLSDLYAMGWDPVVDAGDFGHDRGERLVVTRASKHAYTSGGLSDDIAAEHGKLAWADTVVLQFPMWWAGMPAILKGWFDRVFVKGFAYGVTDPGAGGRTLRYGEGVLAGKRAMVVVTIGAREAAMGPRGINGELNALLFPLQHGTLWYSGMSVVEPLAVYGADRLGDADYKDSAARLRERLLALPTSDPIPFRYQNRGDYDDDHVLRSELAPGRTGLAVHDARTA